VAEIIRCVSCDGYGWFEEVDGRVYDCDWCGGVGYVYRDADGTDRKIPETDYAAVAERLEQLEAARMREMGYSGTAKKPWEQAIRQDRDSKDET
jgi:hypothetical protein